MIDERLVTISLSGSDSPSGLCAKCTTLLTSTLEAKRLRTRFVSGATIDSMDSSIVGNHQLPTDIRKRHRSELQTRVTRKPVAPVTSLDDSCLTSLSETQPTIEPRPFPLPHESDDFCQSWDEESLLKLASCGCWCRGWAKVQIRHAFGDSIWFVSLNGFSPNPKIPVDSLNAAKIIGDILTAFIPQSPPKFQLSSTPDKTAEADWEFRQKKLSPGEFASGTNLAAETANLSTSRNSSQPDFETPTGTESNVLGFEQLN